MLGLKRQVAILAVLLASAIPTDIASSSYSPLPIPIDFTYDNKKVEAFNAAYDATRKIDAKQLQCMALNIYHEARGETREGKIGVAMVTINRTKSGIFPETICEVVYQRGQYQWAANNPRVSDKKAWNVAVGLAIHVILDYNQIVDPTHGALYFHERSVKVFWKSQKTKAIGLHVFYRTPGTKIYNVQDLCC